MPQRPREHAVEQESRDASRAVLPAEWTVADTADDYGIDSRVEIFDQGAATGLRFGAQLKATDEPDLRKALKARIDVPALVYMYLRHVADNLVGAAQDTDADPDGRAGPDWYSAGNFLFHRVHDYPAALAAYENAARAAGSDYEQQAYYLGELGAAQHETGAYAQAADTYALAIAADPTNPNVRACRADSLARAGRYQDALDELDGYEQAVGPAGPSPTWALSANALRHVVAQTGITAQDRVPAGADGEPPDDLALDALSPRAWLAAIQKGADEDRDISALEGLLVMCAYAQCHQQPARSEAVGERRITRCAQGRTGEQHHHGSWPVFIRSSGFSARACPVSGPMVPHSRLRPASAVPRSDSVDPPRAAPRSRAGARRKG